MYTYQDLCPWKLCILTRTYALGIYAYLLQTASIRLPERTLRHTKHLIACRNRAQTYPQKWPFATAKQHLIACRNRAQIYPQKLPNATSEFLEKIYLFCLLQLLSGGAKQHLIACRNRAQTYPQKWPFATAKQHLIACRNRAQIYPQKLPNAPSECLEKIYLFLSPTAVVWWLQTASIRLPEGTFATAKQLWKTCSHRLGQVKIFFLIFYRFGHHFIYHFLFHLSFH